MLVRTFVLALVLLSPLTLQASETTSVANHSSCVEKKGTRTCKLNVTGTINLAEVDGKSNAQNIPLQIENIVEGDINLYQSKDKGMNVMKGGVSLKNVSEKKSFVNYVVVLKNDKGEAAKTEGTINLTPGKIHKINISSIKLKEQDLKDINEFEINIVETNKDTQKHKKNGDPN